MTLDTKERFAFGKNWSNFLTHLNLDRIVEAEKSLKEKLAVDGLDGKVFLDIGCGSGLFSLAAHRLGARVFSFDYDQDSVACTQYLKERYGDSALDWSIEQGSVLDNDFLSKFGQVDVVYSWGVLHHTGNMYQAFKNISSMVSDKGKLFISIYNDQGISSKIWKKIKGSYVKYPFLRSSLVIFCGLWLWKYRIAWGLVRYGNPIKFINSYGQNNRGMSAKYDLVDWVGGYPFEVAKPEEIFEFFKEYGFVLEKMKTCAGGLGCNEFIFVKQSRGLK